MELKELNKIHGVYKIINIKNNKMYIGSSVNLKTRILKHFADLKKRKHCNTYLQRSYNKYGREAFIFEIAEFVADKQYLVETEQKWMDYYQSYNKKLGYNIRVTANSNLGIVMSKETKEKMSKSRTGKKRSEEARINTANGVRAALGKKVINLDTGLIFECIVDARKHYGTPASINLSCSGKCSSAGGYSWAFIDSDGQILYPKKFKNKKMEQIINLDTLEVFESITEACKKYNIPNISSATRACKGMVNTSGGYRWAYLDSSGEPIIMNKKFKYPNRPVRNIDTGQIFTSIINAAKSANVYRETMSNACKSGRIISGCRWEFVVE